MTRLPDLGLTIADIDLGGIDAESDTRLDDYFVTTPYVRSALSGRRTTFLGRKGSGKSALFRQLPRLVRESDLECCGVLLLTPDQYAWAALKEYREQGLLDEHAFTNAWKLTLAVEIAGAYADMDVDWLPRQEGALAKLTKFLTDNYGTLRPGLVATARSVVKGLRSFDLSAFGFGVGMSREASVQPLTPAVADGLMDAAAVLSETCTLLVGLDRLDDSWDGSDKSKSLMIGLLKAAKDINDQFGTGSLQEGLRVDVFIRSDIYDALRFDDKDKHRSREQNITWTVDQLREMVDRRLPEGVAVDDILEEGDMRGSIAPFNYIVKRTFLRPREVLQFLDECARVAQPDAPEIRKDDIRRAEERYSRWKVDDLKQEYRRAFPEFDDLLEIFRQEVHRYEGLGDLAALIERKVPRLVEQFGTRFLMEALFDYSVIGVRLGGAGSTRFKSEDSELTLPSSGTVYVHQSLYRGLNIREARRTTDNGA